MNDALYPNVPSANVIVHWGAVRQVLAEIARLLGAKA